jgi:metal-responsive CopG/Arc/MetJ family transcriptional regulator
MLAYMLAYHLEVDMTRTTILIEDDLLLEVKQLARSQGTTTTEIIREALKAYIGRRRRARVPSFTGVGRSGRRSVSKNAEAILRQKVERREGW